MKKYIWFLAALLLLAGCATQPTDPTPTAPPEVIKPTSFTLNASDMSFFNPGELYDLKVRLVPADAEMPDVTWTSSDPNIASVSWNGRVTAISGGTVTITATIEGLGEQTCIFRCQFTHSATPALEATPAPTPAPTSVGIEVDIGDGEHTFWVVLAKEEEGTQVNIYRNRGDSEPVQSFVEEEGFVDLVLAELTAEDVDFDGCMDFHFYTSFGYSIVSYSSYYVWDPEEQCFRPDPYGLNELPTVEFSPYWKEVSSLSRGPMGTAVVSYQYENGALVEVGESFYPEEDSTEKAYTAHWITVDDEHTFWVKLTEREKKDEDSGTPVLVSVYNKDGKLYQSFEDEIWRYRVENAPPYGIDVNFDGCMDFGYRSWLAASTGGSAYYVWDPKAEQFVRDPYGLEDLSLPKFDHERQVIETWSHSGNSYTIEFYCYLNGKLTCIRRLCNQDNYKDDFTATLTVEDYDERTGTLKEVYREENAKIGGVTYASTEEFQRWHNIDYHGE